MAADSEAMLLTMPTKITTNVSILGDARTTMALNAISSRPT